MGCQLTQSIIVDPGHTVQAIQTIATDGGPSLDRPIPAGGEPRRLPGVAFDVADVAVLFILSDQDLELRSNDPANAADVIDLRAGDPLIWRAEGYYRCPFHKDVVRLFALNHGEQPAKLQLRVGVKPLSTQPPQPKTASAETPVPVH